MEALHQLAELFQQAVTKNGDRPNSVAPLKMTPTQQDPQARVPTTTPTHDAHPHCSNIIEDDDINQPLELDHRNQPLGLGLLPQRNNSLPHYILPDSVTSPRVARIHRQPITPFPRVEQPPWYQTRSYTRRLNSISSKYADAENYIAIVEANYVTHPITGRAQEYRQLLTGDKKEAWKTSFANKLRRLAQGFGNQIDGTNTIYFKQKYVVPRREKVTYGHLVCDIKEHYCHELQIGSS